MKTALVVIGAAMLLTGCNSASRPGRGELLMSDEEVTAKDDTICRGYGAQPGTPVYIQCRATQDQRRDAERQARLRS
jgi:hypothetical protein